MVNYKNMSITAGLGLAILFQGVAPAFATCDNKNAFIANSAQEKSEMLVGYGQKETVSDWQWKTFVTKAADHMTYDCLKEVAEHNIPMLPSDVETGVSLSSGILWVNPKLSPTEAGQKTCSIVSKQYLPAAQQVCDLSWF